MAEVEAKCPSGLHVEVRGLKGQELDSVANKQQSRRENVGMKIAAACTRKVIDPGPYELQADGSLAWGDILIGDLTYLMVMIRHATYLGTREEKFSFKTKCPNDDCYHNETAIEWVLDLQSDLPVQRWDGPARDKFKEGTPYMVKLDLIGYTNDPDFHAVKDGSYTVTYKLVRGRDQKKRRQIEADPDHQMTSALMQRITTITYQTDDGIETIDRNDMRTWLGELDYSDLDSLVESMDDHDCGVDTTIPIECPRCGEEWEVELPFERFWKKQKRRRGATTS